MWKDAAASIDRPSMTPFIALLLGIVEGLTEYLPVSSTGHLVLASHFLGARGDGADAFDVVIQAGAILAVLVHYRRFLAERTLGLVRGEAASKRLLAALVLGFVPTAVTGLLLRKTIKRLLFGPLPVVAALFLGGLLMIGVELVRARRPKTERREPEDGIGDVTPLRGFLIGLGQCVSLWPGSSRSMCTILAGQATGLSTKTAAEFSFLLGLPTLGAATAYEALKARHVLATEVGTVNVLIGLLVSFLVAWGVIAAFIRYLGKRGLLPFGAYRVALAIVVFFVLARGGSS